MPSGTRTSAVGPYTAAVAQVLTQLVGGRSKASVGKAARIERPSGETVGIERSMLSRMLDGKKAITVDELVAICDALDISPRAVVTAADEVRTGRLPAGRGGGYARAVDEAARTGDPLTDPAAQASLRAHLAHDVLGQTQPNEVEPDERPSTKAR